MSRVCGVDDAPCVRVPRVASRAGISLKTQELYLLVFLTRYLDLFFRFYSVYNTSMKLFYILASGAIVYALRVHRGPWRVTYEQNSLPEDKMQHWLLCVAPCAVLALLLNEGRWADLLSGAGVLHYLFEACWAFSEYLEAVAVLPQLVLVTNSKSAENITAWYLLSLGAYRALYLANWVYRYRTEKGCVAAHLVGAAPCCPRTDEQPQSARPVF